jgi:hypothetical protein
MGLIMDSHLLLTILSGLCWTVVYIDGIRIGIKDKSYAIPFWALALNLAWELLYAVHGYGEYGLKPQTIINAIWFVFDIGIFYTYFRHGLKYFPKNIKPGWFYIWGILGLLTAFVLQSLFIQEFGLHAGAKYSAFLQNLLMSILFIVMLVQRGSREGQSLLIAVNKWVGTLAPTILYGILAKQPSTFVLAIGIMISFFDMIYILMLARTKNLTQSHGFTPG